MRRGRWGEGGKCFLVLSMSSLPLISLFFQERKILLKLAELTRSLSSTAETSHGRYSVHCTLILHAVTAISSQHSVRPAAELCKITDNNNKIPALARERKICVAYVHTVRASFVYLYNLSRLKTKDMYKN